MGKTVPGRDHSSFALKLLLRRRLRDGIAPGALVDFFAGEGRILLAHAGAFGRVRACEQDPGRAGRLRERLHRAGLARAEVLVGNNRDLVPAMLAGLEPDFLDFDAYGNPHPLIREVFRSYLPARRAAVAVTDGGRMQLLRGDRFRPADWMFDPGPDDRLSAPVTPVLRSEHELWVRSFWDRLASDRGLRLVDFFGAWPRGRRVFYYGLWIEPK